MTGLKGSFQLQLRLDQFSEMQKKSSTSRGGPNNFRIKYIHSGYLKIRELLSQIEGAGVEIKDLSSFSSAEFDFD